MCVRVRVGGGCLRLVRVSVGETRVKGAEREQRSLVVSGWFMSCLADLIQFTSWLSLWVVLFVVHPPPLPGAPCLPPLRIVERRRPTTSVFYV